MNTMLLSICIPSSNRLEQLFQLLESVDAKSHKLEIMIGEDAAPIRAEARVQLAAFRRESLYPINCSDIRPPEPLRLAYEIK
jgi:hypothetical protein